MKTLSTADRVLQSARQWLGTPYQHQASVQGVGCDCLGLIRGIWRDLHGKEPETAPHYSSVWSDGTDEETMRDAFARHLLPVSLSKVQPGDVLLFQMRPYGAAKHTGILSDPHRFVHAYQGAGVVESALNPFWQRATKAAFRFPTLTKV
ncbi:MAG: NlpC/P60 family protein [Pseudomonadota bacterium]